MTKSKTRKRALEDSADPINLKIKGQDGATTHFRVDRKAKLRRMFLTYCESKQMEYGTVRFLYEGQRIRSEKTPDELGMQDGDEIDAFLYASGGGRFNLFHV